MAFVVAILPLIGIWLAKVVIWPRRFWIHFYDPETIYFYAGLDLLRGELPENVDNPGTPLQMLSAAIAAFSGATPARYEAFLSATHAVELLLLAGGAAIVFYGVFRDTATLARITGVWLYFTAPQALERMDVWSPEILYLPIGAAMIAVFRGWMVRPSHRRAAAIGILGGLGTAAKFVFLPWPAALVLTFLIGRRFRDAAAAIAGTIVGFVLGTLPVASEYGSMFRRLLFLSGTGHADQTWPQLLMTAKAWAICVAIIGVVVLLCLRHSPPPLTVFCLLVVVLSIAVSARNPSFRYLLPTAVALAGLFASAAATERFTARWQLIVLACIALLFAKTAFDDVATHRRRIAEGEHLRARIEAAVPREAVVVYGWRAPIPSFALRIMTRDERDLAEVSRLYPREGHVNPWTRQIHLPNGSATWHYAVVSAEDVEPLRAAGGTEVGRVDGFVVLISPSAFSRRSR